ncbi:MAG: FAD-binding oxidoreductase [Halioglobus sp.]
MHRRNFCRAALASAALAPMLGSRALASVYAGLMSVDRDLEAVSLSGAEQILTKSHVQSLADTLRGNLLLPGNTAYESARHVLNPSINKHPALIVQPTGPADIGYAVDFARENALVVAVKCGGHSYSGKSTCEGGLMIDLSTFRDVRVDLPNQSAFVTGGSLLGELDHESMAAGLVTTSGTVSHTGVGGLTTGGGFGRVGRRFGLALDNVKSVDVVSADGRLRHASAEENPDLYWAVRGGGGNFGVVTNFEFQLHPMDRQVIGGNLVYPISKLPELLEIYAEYSPGCPDELYSDLIAVYPYGDKPGVALLNVCWSGPASNYEKAMLPYKALGEPLQNGVEAIDYVALQRSGDTTDARSWASYQKSGFIEGFKPGLIDTLLDGMEPHPDRSTILIFQHSGGAINQVAPDTTAFPHRYATHNMIPMVSWRQGAPQDEHVRYIRSLWSQLQPFTHGFYTAEVNDGHDVRAMNGNYQDNYPRLASIKKRYDPQNIFRLNANITPD